MKSIKGLALASAVLTVSGLSASVAAAQSASPPTPPCTAQGPQNWVYGQYRNFLDCTYARSNTDYGQIWVYFSEPSSVTPAAEVLSSNSRRQRWIAGARRFLGLQDNRSGAIVLEVYENASGTSTSAPRLLYTRALAAFEIDESAGLRVSDVGGSIDTQIGPYLQAASSPGVEWRITVRRSNRPVGEIVSLLTDINEAANALTGGVVFTAGQAALDVASSIETRIETAVTENTTSPRTGNLSFAPQAINQVEHHVSLFPVLPETNNPSSPDLSKAGFLRVSVRRRVSVFPGEHTVANGEVHYAWPGADGAAFLRGFEINGTPLSALLSSRMQGHFVNLASEDAAAFGAACNSLNYTLENDPLFARLHPSDITAIRWAFGFSRSNMRKAAVRAEPCAQSFLNNSGNLTARGLQVASPEIVLPEAYADARTQAETAERTGRQAFSVGQTKAAEAFAINASDAFTGLNFTFIGTASSTSPETLIGTAEFTGVAAAERYFGEALLSTGTAVTLAGAGEFRLRADEAAAPSAGGEPDTFVGRVQGRNFVSGRLVMTDGSSFYGSFQGRQPFEGLMTLRDGVRRYGRFRNYVLDGPGVEFSSSGVVSWGEWVGGVRSIVNPPQ